MVIRGKSKVGQFNGHSFVRHQDVLWLQVPVVDSNGMTIFNGIKDLEKSPPGKSIVANVLPSFGDIGKEIALRTVLNDHVRAIGRVHDLYQGNNIWVNAGLVVQLDFPLLEFPLPWLQA